jgi:recombinational DNA repair ATPase RecF
VSPVVVIAYSYATLILADGSRKPEESNAMFRSLEIHTWRQIEQVEIQFHPRLTILTGANGSGKTTILNLISRHFGWSIPLVSTPKRDKKSVIEIRRDCCPQLSRVRSKDEEGRVKDALRFVSVL